MNKDRMPLDRTEWEHGVYVYSLIDDSQELLKEMGIEIITGEACALSMRKLCYLTHPGMSLVLDFLGLRMDMNNLPIVDTDHYSMFLEWETLNKIITYYLCHFFSVVQVETIKADSGFRSDFRLICAASYDDIKAHVNAYASCYDRYDDEGKIIPGSIFHLGRSYSTGNGPHNGFSNIHAMWGFSQ